jgi:hypothetical protein
MSVTEGRAEDVWTRTYALPAGGALEIAGQDGTIHVSGSDVPGVEVRAEREARADSDEAARQLLGRLQIREDVTGGSVRIATVGGENRWAPPGLGRRALTRVEYQVRVPAGLMLTFKTENGAVRLSEVSGRITATVTNGGITGEGLSGSITAHTVNGGVRVDLAAITGDVLLSTTNGGVRLTLPPSANVNLEASAVNGGIDIDDEFGVAPGDGSNRRVTATMNGGGPTVSASSVNGGIRIRARGSNQPD